MYHDGKVITRVRSGGYGYTLKKNIFYAYLPIELAKPGTHLSVECFGIEYQAIVEKEPLYDPKGEKIKAYVCEVENKTPCGLQWGLVVWNRDQRITYWSGSAGRATAAIR